MDLAGQLRAELRSQSGFILISVHVFLYEAKFVRTFNKLGENGDLEAEDDAALVCRLQGGDSKALAELWNRYAALLYSQAARILNNPAETDDVVAEVFEEVWQRGANYRPERARPVAWLLNLVRRRAIDHLRERQSYQGAGERMQQEGGLYEGRNLVEEQVRLSDLRGIWESALNRLPDEKRRTVWLAYCEGLSQREISKCTDTPLGTVKSRIEMGLRKMREGLNGSPPGKSAAWR